MKVEISKKTGELVLRPEDAKDVFDLGRIYGAFNTATIEFGRDVRNEIKSVTLPMWEVIWALVSYRQDNVFPAIRSNED